MVNGRCGRRADVRLQLRGDVLVVVVLVRAARRIQARSVSDEYKTHRKRRLDLPVRKENIASRAPVVGTYRREKPATERG